MKLVSAINAVLATAVLYLAPLLDYIKLIGFLNVNGLELSLMLNSNRHNITARFGGESD